MPLNDINNLKRLINNMKKHQRTAHSATSAAGRKLFVCALATALMQMSFPVVAEELAGGG